MPAFAGDMVRLRESQGDSGSEAKGWRAAATLGKGTERSFNLDEVVVEVRWIAPTQGSLADSATAGPEDAIHSGLSGNSAPAPSRKDRTESETTVSMMLDMRQASFTLPA